MRYIADSSGYLKEVAFGCLLSCDGEDCTEYTGSVPEGYTSLEAWYLEESDKLYRWKIVSGNLTLDSSAVAPGDAADLALGALWNTTDNDGSVFNAYLDGLLQNMPNGSIKSIWFNDYPHYTGSHYHGILYKHTDNYASLLAHNYEQILFKRKLETWHAWERVHGIDYEVPNRVPAVVGSRVDVVGGGYYVKNKTCYVQMVVKLNTALGGSDYWNIFNGMPAPCNPTGHTYAALAATKLSGTSTINAYMAGNSLLLVLSADGLKAGDTICITGSYITT